MLLPQHRGAHHPEMIEQLDEGFEPLAAIGVDVKGFVVEKTFSSLETDAPLTHVALDDFRRCVALASKRTGEIAAGIKENVAATPVDELEQSENRKTDAEPVLNRLIHVRGAGDALLHQPGGFVHCEGLNARNDVTRPRSANHRHLADTFKERLQPRDDGRIGADARRKLNQWHQEGWIEVMGIEEALRLDNSTGEIVDKDR